MNAVEIEEAISALAEQPFDAGEFPYLFLQAFGNKETTLKRLRKGESNKSDLGGVLQTNNIHIAVAAPGEVTNTLAALKASPATTRAKARFVQATDGDTFEAEDLASGETVVCAFADFPDHFGFFLPLAGITTVKQVRDSSFDIRATSRLNRLYVELLRDNPEWGTAERRPDMNHFMARLIFCFFAEDTDIFGGTRRFTTTVEQMSAKDSSNTHEVIGTLFRAMNMKSADRVAAGIPRWADQFPYVNGGLFSGSMDVPRFSRIARSYLLHIGNLDWTKINPDIFGSMIQAVAEDEERGALGMHYTSVPNILKVLNPLFLDDLRTRLAEAGDNPRMLLNLRKRMSRIRIFDPACGSGNFLVIAYKQMRAIEAEIDKRRGEADRRSDIPLTNFRGIELRDFPAEIARLALIIAEYQCDVLYRGQKEALRDFLPLDAENWITCGNALRLDWLSICPSTGTGVKHQADDLFHTPLDQAQIDFENEGGETYICGNPPYLGSTWQSAEQKYDLQQIFDGRTKSWKSLDYVAGWFMKAADYGTQTNTISAFVATNSICQGQQVPILWPLILQTGHEIAFAHTSFKWANLASHNAGVTVAIIGISNHAGNLRRLFSIGENGTTIEKQTDNINAYLAAGRNIIVSKESSPISTIPKMIFGNKVVDGGHLRMSRDEIGGLGLPEESKRNIIRRIYGSADFIRGESVYCLWIDDKNLSEAMSYPTVAERIEAVKALRLASPDKSANQMADRAHQFREMRRARNHTIVLPRITSENREFLPVGIIDASGVVSSQSFALYDEPIWLLSIIASRLHVMWIATVCGRTRTDFAYSNTLGWNTFPVPALTEKNIADLTRCAEDILLAREAHFPATVADLYNPDNMPADLREAHERNDEVLERIYIGRRFRNDTERLEKLFDLYTKITATPGKALKARKAASA
ncbi:class I SAM-dependent DNA methyltransferase [Agrobacterium vitis]|uniref:class I SAM-dependent DNA methyltransferase n=1 Tax=Rhizobium/Agrobacterium group TaxID=227290 RepID=UPI001F3BBA3A|nr:MULTISPECIES: DNA methyltransferase [Rhizobium/Agrobacterium group]MCF1501710.1 class I SAM-dependent DNA methyltransferase [Allorhizobium sp. Av2]MCM2438504.1 class I SAM-dependent DNA methyltransferase [Agrobacterium vitis]MCM2473160.1 class I SAM-dependent DNA methyltransferase [Rhizobium sp. CG5]